MTARLPDSHGGRVTGAVLAAGAGSRMGSPKATLYVSGVRLVDRAVHALAAAGCDPVVAVVRRGTNVPAATTVVNDDPGRGQRSSLALALDAARECDAIAVVLVDTPGVGVDAIRAVVSAWRPGRVATARFAGRRAHPIVMAPALWRLAIERAGPDEGARQFLAAHPDLVDAIDVVGDPTDLDTPDDLARWERRPTT